MSQENVRIVESLYADPQSRLAFEFYTPEIEWDMTNYSGWADDPVYHGHDGVRDFMRGWISSFDEWEPTIERVVDAGDDVIAVVADVAYLRGSRMPIRRRFAHVFTFRDGRIVRSRLYSDPAEALASARVASGES